MNNKDVICTRCKGIMVPSISVTDNECPVPIFRCLNCGDVIDDIILKNRELMQKEK